MQRFFFRTSKFSACVNPSQRVLSSFDIASKTLAFCPLYMDLVGDLMSVGVILLLHAFTLSIHTARGRKSSILSAGSTGGQEDQPIAGDQVKRLDL